MTFSKSLTVEMKEHGFDSMFVNFPGQKVLAFEKANGAADMYCYIYFRYMPALKEYDVSLGVESVRWQIYVEKALERFSQLSEGLTFNSATSPTTRVVFNADEFTRNEFGKTLPSDEALIQPYLKVLFASAVTPIFSQIKTDESLLHLLLRMDPPFKQSWLSRRVLLIIKLAIVVRADWGRVRASLQEIEKFLRNDAYVDGYPGSLIDDAYEYFLKEEALPR